MERTARHPLRNYVLANAEDRPGVYRWRAPDGRLLYVGKSVRLRSRLLSYFRASAGKAARVVGESSRVEWEYLPDEFAALFREMQIIREWQPEYNVEHKRKRRFAFIKVTRERAPRLIPVARVTNDGASYYGPFGRKGWLSDAVHDLVRTVGLRDCTRDMSLHFTDQADLFGGERAPKCMRGETGSCLAPCAGGCTNAEYMERVELARSFLEGQNRKPLDGLERSLQEAASQLDFERAAQIRDRIQTLQKLHSHLASFRGQVEKLNLVYPVTGFGGSRRIYLIRRGRLRLELPFPQSDRERRRIERTVRELYRPMPEDVRAGLTHKAAAEVLLLISWFNRRPAERERAVVPEQWLNEAAA